MTKLTSDNIFRAIEKITMQHIVCFHEEAKNYAFKNLYGEWQTLNKNFVEDFVWEM